MKFSGWTFIFQFLQLKVFFFFLIWLYWCEHSHAGENVFEKVWWESHQIDFKHLNKIHLMNINNIIEIKSLTYLQDLMSSPHPVYFHWKTASWEERLIYHECCLHFYYRILFHNYLLKMISKTHGKVLEVSYCSWIISWFGTRRSLPRRGLWVWWSLLFKCQ